METKDFIFHNPEKEEKQKVLKILKSGDSNEICNTLIAVAFHEEDLNFCIEVIVKCINHSDDNVKGVAILCIGHLARIHGELPEDMVIPIMLNALKSEVETVMERVVDVMSDIYVYMPVLWRKINKLGNIKIRYDSEYLVRFVVGYEKNYKQTMNACEDDRPFLVCYKLGRIGLASLQKLYNVSQDDPNMSMREMTYNFPINAKQAKAIQPFVTGAIDVEKYNFYLETQYVSESNSSAR